MLGRDLFVQRAADYGSEETLTDALFGLREYVDTDLVESPGLIEKADRGVLFLDDADKLPRRIQQRLIPVLDDGALARVGDATPAPVDVRLILASNEAGPTHGLTLDMLARLRRVQLPPLKDRLADIPDLFNHLLKEALNEAGQPLEPVFSHIDGAHYMTLMGYRFKENNIHGLKAVADAVAAGMAKGAAPETAIKKAISALNPSTSRVPTGDRREDVTRKVSTVLSDIEEEN